MALDRRTAGDIKRLEGLESQCSRGDTWDFTNACDVTLKLLIYKYIMKLNSEIWMLDSDGPLE